MTIKYPTPLVAPPAPASITGATAPDTLVLRSGKTLDGNFVGTSQDMAYLRVVTTR